MICLVSLDASQSKTKGKSEYRQDFEDDYHTTLVSRDRTVERTASNCTLSLSIIHRQQVQYGRSKIHFVTEHFCDTAISCSCAPGARNRVSLQIDVCSTYMFNNVNINITQICAPTISPCPCKQFLMMFMFTLLITDKQTSQT